MQTKSVIINSIVGFFKRMNKYYEYSFIYKILMVIYDAGRKSAFVQWVNSVFFQPSKKNYYEGSLFLKAVTGIFSVIMAFVKTCYGFLAEKNRKSLNKAAFDCFSTALKKPEKAMEAICGFLGGFCLIRGMIGLIGGYGLVTVAVFCGAGAVLTLFTVAGGGFIIKAVTGSLPFKAVHWLFREG